MTTDSAPKPPTLAQLRKIYPRMDCRFFTMQGEYDPTLPHIPMLGSRINDLDVLMDRGDGTYDVKCTCLKLYRASGRDMALGIVASCPSCEAEDGRSGVEVSLAPSNNKTYHSWNYMRAKAKKNGDTVDPRWRKFPRFLRDMGEKQEDRPVVCRHDDREPYGPDNCYWGTKQAPTLPTRRRRSEIFLKYSVTGEALTVPEWAKKTGVSANTLYVRRNRGWSGDEVITGVRNSKVEDIL